MSTPRFAVTQGIDHLRDNLGGAAASRKDKLNTFDGVFIPVALSIWGIIVVGLLGTVLLFSGGYLITSSTTLSISAICSNGLVKGGGAYYLISRSLGPEFGGSIGLLYSLATVLTGSMSVVGFVEPFLDSFGKDSGSLGNVFEESRPWRILYGTVLLAICGFISFLGSKLFAKASLVLAGILSVSTISVILSLLFRPPFSNDMVNLTGFSLETLYGNLYPSFTNEFGQEQSFRTIFAIIFPACTGILAGAAMSGDLKYPSKAIPKGTLGAVGFTFIAYMILAVVLAGSVDRKTLHENFGVLQDTAFYPELVVIGVLSAAFFTALGAIVGAAKMLQAISKDGLLGVLTPFAYGRPKDNEPVTAITLILVLIEIMVLIADDINQIAPFVTMFCLLTFGITNLACFILRVTGAPNFRPSFHYFSWESALFGLVSCFSAMVYVDTLYSSISFIVFVSLFFAIHFFAPAKDDWGDVSQSIIYHQVRKYLLQLDSRKDHVKFWRPQILLLVNSPLKHYKLIKKGGLFVLGHTIVGEFDDVSPIFKKQVHSWLRFVDLLHLKAFVNVTIAKDERIGAQSLLMGSGLGGMRPNIVVLGFHKNNTPAISEPSKSTSITTLSEQTSDDEHSGSIFTDPPIDTTPFDPSKFYYDHSLSDTDIDLLNTLPLDQSKISSESYVGIIEDAIKLEKAVAVMRGLERLEWFTGEKIKDDRKGRSGSVYSGSEGEGEPLLPKYVVLGVKKQKFIDLWPIQIHDEMHPEAAFGKNL
ncbi:hypothetical protein HK098_003958 [Nowakowskiella sp. JEL0407]|nr:hypothetical protein HK098_003958 [Nowakowskiella sp. JEL0407]